MKISAHKINSWVSRNLNDALILVTDALCHLMIDDCTIRECQCTITKFNARKSAIIKNF